MKNKIFWFSVLAALGVHGLLLSGLTAHKKVDLSILSGHAGTMSVSFVDFSRASEYLPNDSEAETIEEAQIAKRREVVQEILQEASIVEELIMIDDAPIAEPEAAPEVVQREETTNQNQQDVELKKSDESVIDRSQASSFLAQDADAGVEMKVITEPQFQVPPTPVNYPKMARRRGIEGVVWLDVWVTPSGETSTVEIHKSSGVGMLDRAALKAVRQWHFQPQSIDGRAVESHIRIPIEFSLS